MGDVCTQGKHQIMTAIARVNDLEWIMDKMIFDKIACLYCRFISLVLLLFVFSCCVDRVALDTLAALLKSSKFLNTRNNSN